MSLSDFTRTDENDIAHALRLAATVQDRTKAEQKALSRLADKIDRRRNRQTVGDALTRGCTLENRGPCTYRLAEDRARPEVNEAARTGNLETLAKTLDHPKTCPCRGDGLAHEPPDGWSRLAAEVAP